MVEHEYKDLFYKRNTDKQLKIATDDGLFIATNSDIKWENFELTESLCSDSELRFGSCETSAVKFQILNAFIPLSGKWLTITETIGRNTDSPFQYGKYKVISDVPTADKEYRDITAYDAMYDILNADVSEWYKTILPNKDSTKTLKQFRKSFIQYFGLKEVVPEDGLANDNMTVERTIDPEQISGKDVITAICEINGCFGHIGRDGKFHYIYLPQDIQGLYPANFLYPDHVPEQWDYLAQEETGHLYPQNPKTTKLGEKSYIKCQYEDYHVRQINKLQIRQEENDIGTIYPKTEPSVKDNSYIIEDNFLVYGKSTEQLDEIAKNIYNKISGIVYMPFSMECVGNPCFEVGDPIRSVTKYALIESYIFSRILSGIQNKMDSYSAKGSEKRPQEVNSVQKSIRQLKGKANILTRTMEETRSEIYDLERETSSRITQTAESITAEVTRATQAEGTLSSRITQTAESITAEVTRATQAEGTLSSRITQTAESITATVSSSMSKYDTEKYNITLYGYVSATSLKMSYKASEHDGEYYLNQSNGRLYLSDENEWKYVKKLKLITENLSSRIEQTAQSISLSVNNGSTTAGITISVTNENGSTNEATATIEMKGLVSFTNLRTSGQTTIDGGNITTGTINANKVNVTNIDGQNIKSQTIETKQLATDCITTRTIKAEAVTAEQIKTGTITADKLAVAYATIENLNATNARITSLEADRITASEVAANYATITSLDAVNAKFNSINANNITAGTLSVERLNIDGIISGLSGKTIQCINFTAQTIRGSRFEYYNGSTYDAMSLKDITINGVKYKLLGV